MINLNVKENKRTRYSVLLCLVLYCSAAFTSSPPPRPSTPPPEPALPTPPPPGNNYIPAPGTSLKDIIITAAVVSFGSAVATAAWNAISESITGKQAARAQLEKEKLDIQKKQLTNNSAVALDQLQIMVLRTCENQKLKAECTELQTLFNQALQADLNERIGNSKISLREQSKARAA